MRDKVFRVPTSSLIRIVMPTFARMVSCCTQLEPCTTAMHFAIALPNPIVMLRIKDAVLPRRSDAIRTSRSSSGRQRCRSRVGQNRGFRAVAQLPQARRDAICTSQAHFELGRLRFRGPRGAQDEFTLAANCAKPSAPGETIARPPPASRSMCCIIGISGPGDQDHS